MFDAREDRRCWEDRRCCRRSTGIDILRRKSVNSPVTGFRSRKLCREGPRIGPSAFLTRPAPLVNLQTRYSSTLLPCYPPLAAASSTALFCDSSTNSSAILTNQS